MRLPILLACLTSTTICLAAGEALASEPAEDADFGTTPAQKGGARKPTAAPAPAARSQSSGSEALGVDESPADEDRAYRASRNAPLATDPPIDWAVLHAGLRPHLGTFGGIATLALAHA